MELLFFFFFFEFSFFLFWKVLAFFFFFLSPQIVSGRGKSKEDGEEWLRETKPICFRGGTEERTLKISAPPAERRHYGNTNYSPSSSPARAVLPLAGCETLFLGDSPSVVAAF